MGRESPGPESVHPTSPLLQLPGANFWCIITFLTLFLLGIDSAFSMLEAITTVICDAEMGGIQVERLVCWRSRVRLSGQEVLWMGGTSVSVCGCPCVWGGREGSG